MLSVMAAITVYTIQQYQSNTQIDKNSFALNQTNESIGTIALRQGKIITLLLIDIAKDHHENITLHEINNTVNDINNSLNILLGHKTP
jgi:hypothetical protein